MKHVGTGKKVTLTARTAGLPNGEAAEIEVFRAEDHSSLAVLTSKVRSNRIACDWTAEGPDPFSDEPPWILYFKARVKGMETKAGKLQVYTDWVEVHAEDERGRPLEDAEFRVIVGEGEEVRDASTGSEAMRKEDYLPPGPVKIEWIPPYKLLEWLEGEGPVYRAKVRRVCPARVVWPAPVGDDQGGDEEAPPAAALAHTQWINLPPAEEHPERGPVLRIKVTLEDGVAGQPVFARLTWDEEARGDRPPPRIVGGGVTAEWCEQGGAEVSLPDDDGLPDCEATIEVELGGGGGDQVTVHLGGTEACGDQRLTVTNGRRVGVQVTRLETSPPLDLKPAMERLRAASIELEPYHEQVLPVSGLPPGSLLDGAEVGQPGATLLNAGQHNTDWLLRCRQPAPEHDELALHLIAADAAFDLGPDGARHEQTLEVQVRGPRTALTVDDPESFDVLAQLPDGRPCLVEGSWDCLTTGRSGELTPDMIEVDHRSAPDTVVVKLSGEPAELVGEEQPLQLLLTLRVVQGPRGSSGAEDLVLVRSDAWVDDVLDGLGRALGIELPPREQGSERLDALRAAPLTRVRSS
jgi:hypothetical protein